MCFASRENGVFVVCDGMGGAAAGEIASRLAAKTFLDALIPDESKTPRMATPDVRVDAAVREANRAVWEYARKSSALRGMGTTLVGLLLEPGGSPEKASLTLAHVGDSRCYLFRRGVLTLMTQDHSLVEEQVRMGGMTAKQAAKHPMRNIITRAVGSQAAVEPEITHLEPEPGDLYLLASDGLTRDLSDADLAQTFQRAEARAAGGEWKLDSLTKVLIDEANDAGGGDNITVLLLQIK